MQTSSQASPSPSPSPSSAMAASASFSADDLHAVSDGFSALQSFTLWESRTLMVIVGTDRTGRACRLMQLDRTQPMDINLQEDPTIYPSFAIAERAALMQIQASGCPLDRTLKFAALLGFLRLPKVFLVLVMKRDRVGSIGGRWLYTVSEWKLKALGHKSYDNKKNAPITAKYKSIILSDIEMNRDFFFSYFYDLTHTLQHNLLAWKAEKQKREAAQAEAHKAQLAREENEKRSRKALSDAATAASSSASAASSALVVEPWDPEAFDPIANDVPQNRRRSTSHIGGVAPVAPPAVQTLPPLAEEDDDPAEKLGDVESSSRSFDDTADDAPVNSALLNTSSISSRSDRTLSGRKLDSSSPSASTPVSYSAPPAVLDLNAPSPAHSPAPQAGVAVPSAAKPASVSMSAAAPVAAVLLTAAPPAAPAYDEKWLWNLHHAREFLHVLPHGSYWLVPLIHGFCQQHAVRVGRKDVLVTLIARRSRHFAGTRFIKRGVSSLGHVANEVESEQIVCERHAFSEGMGAFSSVVMLRGSIPLYWAQENPKSPKPDIVVYNFDRDFVATKLHMTELFARYGSPIALLSLIKKEEKSPQETRLGMAFNHAIQRVQAQFRMEKLIKEMADQTFSAAGVNDAFVKEQDKKDRLAAMQAAIHAKETLSFPTTAAPAPQPTAQQSLMAQESAFADSAPPYCHPSYDLNTILYCTYDFLGQRHRQQNVLKELRGLVSNLVEEIGVFTFVSAKPNDTRGAAEPVVSVAGALELPVPLAANTTPLQAAMLASNPAVSPGLPLERSVLSTQKGVIRVNCIDCLDRTNVGQFTIGKAAIKIQLRQLGIDDDPLPVPGVLSPGPGGHEVYPELVSILQDMYTQHGDRIAHQYAGSGAMHKEILYDDDDGGADEASIGVLEDIDRGIKPAAAPAAAGGAKAMSKNATQNALSAIKRYYNNNFNDSDKQSAINVFLGNYIPGFTAGRPHIWEMDVYTNLLDSDTKFRLDGDRFRMPYLPQAIGFIQRMRHVNKSGRTKMGIEASKITMAAIGSPMGSPSPSSAATPASPLPLPRFPAAGGAGSARFHQYFSEAYDPSVYESFDDELKRAFQTAVTVKTAPLLMDPGKFVTIASASIGPQSSTAAGASTGGASASVGVSSSSQGATAPLPPITEAADGDYVQIDTSSVGEAPPGAQLKPPAAAANSNPVKRGFTSLLQGARASFSAAMAGSAPPAAAPAQPKPPMQGAAPPVAHAVQQQRAESPVSDGSGVTSLDSLLQQQQRQEQLLKSVTSRAAAAPAPVAVSAPPPSAVASSVTSPDPVSLSSFPEIPASPVPPTRPDPSTANSKATAAAASAAAASLQPPPSLPPAVSGPTSFQTASTSSAMYTGWSPRVTQKRVLPFAVPRMSAMASLDDAAVESEDASSIESAYLRTAAQDMAAQAEYSMYCDTPRLESTPVHLFGGVAPSTQLTRGGVDQARLSNLLSKAVVAAGDPLPAPSDAEVNAVEVVGASLQLSHDQMATLLADNLRDIAALHAEARLAEHRINAYAAAAAAPKTMLAAAPFVLAPLTPAEPNALRRRDEDNRAAFAVLDKTK